MKTKPLSRTIRIAFVLLFALVLLVPLVGAQSPSPQSEGGVEPAVSGTAPTDHLSDSPYMRLPEDLSDWPPILPPEPGSSVGDGTADAGGLVTYDPATGTTVQSPGGGPAEPAEAGLISTPPYAGLLPSGSTPDTVFPPDDRVRVTATANYPWRTIAKLFITFSNGARGWCSGAIIGCANGHGYKVLTAGHCLYQPAPYGWATEVLVYPGLDYTYTPYYYARNQRLTVLGGWYYSQDSGYDMGIVNLDRNVGDFTGWMGRVTAAPDNAIYSGVANTAGYPCNTASGSCTYPVSPVNSMWYTWANGAGATELNHYYYLDTQSGQSGSPVWWISSGNRYIMTVHAYSSSSYNFGTRINQSNYDTLNNLCADTTTFPIPVDKPDLIDDGPVWAGFEPGSVTPGSTPFHAWSDVRNAGTAASGGFYVQYRASANTTCSGSDFLIGTSYVGPMNAFTWTDSDWTGTFPAGLAPGTYYLCWIIDSGGNVAEFDEANNAAYLSSPRIYVGMQPTKAYLPLAFSTYFNDLGEPNDGFDQAWGPLVSGQTYTAFFPTVSDPNDFYYFNMAVAHSVEVWLTNLPAGNDYDLYLYNDADPHGLPGYSGTIGSGNEHIYLASLPAGKYYIRVARIEGSSQTQPYSLRVVYQ